MIPEKFTDQKQYEMRRYHNSKSNLNRKKHTSLNVQTARE